MVGCYVEVVVLVEVLVVIPLVMAVMAAEAAVLETPHIMPTLEQVVTLPSLYFTNRIYHVYYF
jgi:uncharacterized membrane protein YkgB